MRGQRVGRRRAAMGAVAALATALVPGPAAAQTAAPAAAVMSRSAAAQPAAPASGEPACEIRDARLTEISGMVATDDGFVVVNDGADEEARRRIFFLDRACAVVRAVAYPSRPRDTEDLALGPDGTLWVADTGDNDRTRETVAVWRLPPGADRPVLYRLAYPDGAHDAEAMLVTGDGRPLIVTKSSTNLYAPASALRAGGTVPLVKVGQVRLPSSTTSNPYGLIGRAVVTGAATAPGGGRVVLRTYADAFEFDVTGGDVVAALTGGTPRVVPLPDEPQGESITYSRDGRSLLTVSETAGSPAGTRPTVLRYPLPAADAPSPPDRSAAPDASAPPGVTAAPAVNTSGGRSRGVLAAVAAAGVLGVLLLAGGLVATRRTRSRRPGA
ncbi:esterase-like activity of phytase family protein [Micromonospora costi]|nr:esterase-like activity of phytase family protein [Micromonospora costi]